MLNTATKNATERQGPENKPSSSQSKGLSIFHKKEPSKMDFIDKTEPMQSVLDVSYDGLGGHSKVDLFPVPRKLPSLWKPKSNIPKITAKHKLKRPNPSGSQDVGKMFEQILGSNTDKP